jgi:hypothetical protein
MWFSGRVVIQMAFIIEVHERTISYHDDDGAWMGGEYRVLGEESVRDFCYVPTFDHDADEYDNPRLWAGGFLHTLPLARVASVMPIPDRLEADAWLSASRRHRDSAAVVEIKVYLLGDWTAEDRATLFARFTGSA